MNALVWCCALSLALADKPARAQEGKAVDPPGTSGIMARYRLWFAATDANKDGKLDKEELAKAFRGPNAKPFDYVPPPKPARDKLEEKEKPEDKDKSAGEEKDKPD